MHRRYRFIFLCVSLLLTVSEFNARCCTSAIASASVTRHGNPMIWKHRDTSAAHSFVGHVEATDSTMDFVALFNSTDSCMLEAWTGMNRAGLAIINTASYNLAPDTARYRDREGEIMSLALSRCATVDDFAGMLDSLPRPMGVQSNFGVLDASGAAAYFETWDDGYRRCDIADSPTPGLIVRTNYSVTGTPDAGMGYIRENNAIELLLPHLQRHDIAPETFTEELSRSFYHSLTRRDMSETDCDFIPDQDFIPRYSSGASIVIEAIPSPDRDGSRYVMWTALGYPPCSRVIPVTLDSVPELLRPDPQTHLAPLDIEASELKSRVFPISRGSGKHYIYLPALREISAERRSVSLETYKNYPR